MLITEPIAVMNADIKDFNLPIELRSDGGNYDLYYKGHIITSGTPKELQKAVRLAAAIYDKMGWRF